MDLLGYVRQKSADAAYPYRKGALKDEGRDAQALLRGRLHSSVKLTRIDVLHESGILSGMSHYVCKGECEGESPVAGVCKDELCSKSGQQLEACDCEDGSHAV